ncbi:phosphate signaling complex protein PhoU [Spiroplasma endosymbiont of Anurida maritima]|uniref:phosphate signaling complex protein PhoU n=1 Tax=Spiroplasma endosymbiont of Anurida maritima TaxID=2967972 RepID=UPI0036D29B05
MPDKGLDKDISQTNAKVAEMLHMTISQYHNMRKYLTDHDDKIFNNVTSTEESINDLQNTMMKTSVWKIAKRQMVAGDLRKMIGYVIISRDIERIADYAFNICNFINKYNPDNNLVGHLIHLVNKIVDMLEKLDGILNGTLKMAEVYNMPEDDLEIDKIYKTEFKSLIKEIKDAKSEVEIKSTALTIMQLKYIERAGDHILNIVETLIYIKEGKVYDLSKLDKFTNYNQNQGE